MSVPTEAARPPVIESLDPLSFITAIAALKDNEAFVIRWKSVNDSYPSSPRTMYAIGACHRNEKWFDFFINLRENGRFLSFEHLVYNHSMYSTHSTHECTICRKPHGLGPNAKYNL